MSSLARQSPLSYKDLWQLILDQLLLRAVHTLEELRLELKKRIDNYHARLDTSGGAIQRRSLMNRYDLVDNLWWLSLGVPPNRAWRSARRLRPTSTMHRSLCTPV